MTRDTLRYLAIPCDTLRYEPRETCETSRNLRETYGIRDTRETGAISPDTAISPRYHRDITAISRDITAKPYSLRVAHRLPWTSIDNVSL